MPPHRLAKEQVVKRRHRIQFVDTHPEIVCNLPQATIRNPPPVVLHNLERLNASRFSVRHCTDGVIDFGFFLRGQHCLLFSIINYTYSFAHPLIHSSTHSFTHSLIRSFTHYHYPIQLFKPSTFNSFSP